MSYIGVLNYPSSTRTEAIKNAIAGQTVFTGLNYNPAVVEVFQNGLKLTPAAYQATDGSTITLIMPAGAGDVLNILSTDELTAGTIISGGSGGGGAVTSVNGQVGDVVLSTTSVVEGANLYYSAARVLADAPVKSVAGKTGHVSLVVGDISGAASLASPTFIGTPTAPTPPPGDNDTSIATTAFVTAAVVAAATGGPDTAAIEALTGTGILTRTGANTWSLDTTAYAPLASPAFSGAPSAPTPVISSNDTSLATTAFVTTKVTVAGAPGQVMYFGATSAPSGFLIADGSALSRTVFSTLFAVIGTTYGVGDGSTTFNIPDLRGVFPRGLDLNKGYDVGRAIGSYQADDFKSHTHTKDTYGPQYMGSASGVFGVYAWTTGSTTGATGGTETRPKNIALLACIKY